MAATCYLTPRAEGREVPEKGGRGVFARAPIKEGEIIAIWGGEVVSGQTVSRLSPERARLALQVDEDPDLLTTEEGPAD